MTITQLTEDNIFEYAEAIPAQLRGELEREYCRGLACEGDEEEPAAMILWELKSLEDENVPTKAEILFFRVSDKAGGVELLRAFDNNINDDGVSLISFELKDLSDVEKTMLAKNGFTIKEGESRDIEVTVKDFLDLKLGEKKIPSYIQSLSEITSRQYKAAIMASVFHGRYGLLDDLPFLPVTRFDPDTSSCVITDGKVNGLLLVHKMMSGSYIVELLFAMQPDANINLLQMIRYSIRAAGEYMDEEDTVILRRHNKESLLLVKKLFPDRNGDLVIKGEKLNG